MSRKDAAEVIPVLQTFDISSVPTGLYTLHVEIRNKKNEILTSKTLNFQRNNYLEDATAESVQNIDVAMTFAARFDRKDSLIEYLNSCHPIATNLERGTIENQMQYADLPTLQKYFFYFWSRRNEQKPEEAWLVYKEKVDYVDEEYGTRVKEGYETDRGRVYLQYGAPNTIVLRHNPVNVSPYEIWHYYKIGQFNNKRFLFYSREAVTVDFILLHSDMLGEVQNNDWPVVMRSKNVEVRSSESSRNSQNRQNSFAGDELEDLFYNPR
ncbi:MAG: GWxTD domain-containing protein [Flavobacteriales bacterium]